MAKTYGYNARPVSASMYHYQFGEVGGDPRRAGYLPVGISIGSGPFSCCGLSSISGMNGITDLRQFAEKAAWLAALWATTHGKTHYVYVVNPSQDMQRAYEHGALLECGAKLICEFPNLQPGHQGYYLRMYMINLNDGIGRFFDHNGAAFTEPPKAEPTTTKGNTVKATMYEEVAAVAAPKAARKTTVKESA